MGRMPIHGELTIYNNNLASILESLIRMVKSQESRDRNIEIFYYRYRMDTACNLINLLLSS